MVQPTQPNQPKPGPKLTRLLEVFFKELQRHQEAKSNGREQYHGHKLKLAGEAVYQYKGDAYLNKLTDEIHRINKIMKAGDNSHKTMAAAQAALEEWWAYLKSPWEDGEYDNIEFSGPRPFFSSPKLIKTSKPIMATEKQTPVEPGKKSTDAGAVQAAGKPSKFTRGKDVTFKVNSKLTTNLITLGHLAYQALETPGTDIDLALSKRLWVRSVNLGSN